MEALLFVFPSSFYVPLPYTFRADFVPELGFWTLSVHISCNFRTIIWCAYHVRTMRVPNWTQIIQITANNRNHEKSTKSWKLIKIKNNHNKSWKSFKICKFTPNPLKSRKYYQISQITIKPTKSTKILDLYISNLLILIKKLTIKLG